MPLQIGDSSSEGWKSVQDIRVDGIAVNSVVKSEESSLVEVWRRNPTVIPVIRIWKDSTILAPSWALYADVIIIGGGGGGAGGDGAASNSGYGGKSGKWFGITRLVRPGDEIEFTIGIAGRGGQTEKGVGIAGSSTTFIHSGYIGLAVGGTGGMSTGSSSKSTGEDAGSYTHNGWTVNGGKGGSRDYVGITPGGGGGGGSGGIFGRWSPGQNGGAGGAWVRFRSS